MAKLPKKPGDGGALERRIHALYEEVPALRRREVNSRNERLGASQIGNACERALYYQIHHAEPVTGEVPFDGRMRRLFERGHREEAWVVDDLRACGIELINDVETLNEYVARVERGASPSANLIAEAVLERLASEGVEPTQIRFSTLAGHLSGSCDGIVVSGYDDDPRPMLFECKTAGKNPFGKLTRQGVEKAKPKHWAQMQAYMGGIRLGDVELERALYVAVCKDDDRIYVEVVDRVDGAFEHIVDKARRVLTGEDAPARKGTSPTKFPCSWCDYKHPCHGAALPSRNCRTCIHGKPDLGEGAYGEHSGEDAVWRCTKSGSVPFADTLAVYPELTRAEQATGCAWHLYDPEFVTGLDVVAVDPTPGTAPKWVEYANAKGERLRNHVSPVRPLVMRGADVALDAMLVSRDFERAALDSVLGAEAFQIAYARFAAGEPALDALAHGLGFSAAGEEDAAAYLWSTLTLALKDEDLSAHGEVE